MFENARNSIAISSLALAWIACAPPAVVASDGGVDSSVDAGVDPFPDAGIDASRPEVRLELGTGVETFEPFEDGATLDLVTGCQGSQHVWTSVRAWGLVPERAIVTLDLARARDELRVGQLQLRIDLTSFGEGAEIVGLTLVVPDPEEALDEELLMRLHVRDATEAEAELVRPVRIAWGPDACMGHG